MTDCSISTEQFQNETIAFKQLLDIKEFMNNREKQINECHSLCFFWDCSENKNETTLMLTETLDALEFARKKKII